MAVPWTSFTYELYEGPVVKQWDVSVATASETTQLCGPWSFDMLNSDGSALDTSIFTLDTNLNTLSVYTEAVNDAGKVVTIQLVAWQGGYRGY